VEPVPELPSGSAPAGSLPGGTAVANPYAAPVPPANNPFAPPGAGRAAGQNLSGGPALSPPTSPSVSSPISAPAPGSLAPGAPYRPANGQGYPAAGFQGTGFPSSGSPATGYPATGYPASGFPPASVPGFPAARSQGWSGMAIAALVLSLLALSPISLVLGILALRRIRRSGERGRGLAIAATVLSVLGVLFWAAVAAVVVLAAQHLQVTRDASGAVTGPGVSSASQLRVGDCLSTWDTGVVSVITLVPCADAHRAQVFTEGSLPAGAYPGEQAVIAAADQLCTDKASGRNWTDLPGDARVSYLYPRSDGWASGDRHVTCLVVTSAPVTGSATAVDAAASPGTVTPTG